MRSSAGKTIGRVMLALCCGAAACTQIDEPRSVEDAEPTEPPRANGGPVDIPTARSIGTLEVVALFSGSMPTGVTVSRRGRVFVNYPRWGDQVPFTVAEIVSGVEVPFPDAATNEERPGDEARRFVSVQSVVVDSLDRLWVLDTGNPKMEGVIVGAPKLVAIDLATNRVTKSIRFPGDVALPTTYLNDVRFDPRRGTGGMAFITDSSKDGPNGIVVVDLATGRSWRHLSDHPSTKADPAFFAVVEGRELAVDEGNGPRQPLRIGSDGVAISPDGSRLFYCALGGRTLYSVAVDALANPQATPDEVAATVENLGPKPASDGLESDAEGRIYMTDYEHGAIARRRPDGGFEPLVFDPRALWPDTLALAEEGWLYFTANQLHRQPQYNGGRDMRQKPYVLFRVKTDGTPIRP